MNDTAPIPLYQDNDLVKEEPVFKVIKKPSSETAAPILCPDLVATTRLLITKQSSIKQALALKGLNKSFQVTSENVTIYTITEESKRISGYFCYGLRPFTLKVIDRNGLEVLRIERRFSCTARVLPCFLQSVEVYSQGSIVGTIEQVKKPIAPEYLVKNSEGTHLYRIKGPTFVFLKDIQFTIENMDGEQIGATCKRWRSFRSYFTKSADLQEFGVAYEKDLSVQHKVLLLAATLLIDYMYH